MTREEAIQILTEMQVVYFAPKGKQKVQEALEMAIEALQDRPHGEWIHREHCQVDEDAYEIATCSHCKAEITLEYPNDNFCPNCGTRMQNGFKSIGQAWNTDQGRW